jgi:uncharacterized membrane protein (UPF0127 family)
MVFKRKYRIPLFLFACFLFVVFFIFLEKNESENISRRELNINGKKISVEVVADKKRMELGLGGRGNLCENCGMLFVFAKEGIYPFWMKGMLFDLDIIWIKNGRIVKIVKNISKNSMETITPDMKSDCVLEIPAGMSNLFDFKEGDLIHNL